MSNKKPKSLTFTGVVEKIVSRGDLFRLVVKTATKQLLADFEAPPQAKFKKGLNVRITGDFKSEGFAAICLQNCKTV